MIMLFRTTFLLLFMMNNCFCSSENQYRVTHIPFNLSLMQINRLGSQAGGLWSDKIVVSDKIKWLADNLNSICVRNNHNFDFRVSIELAPKTVVFINSDREFIYETKKCESTKLEKLKLEIIAKFSKNVSVPDQKRENYIEKTLLFYVPFGTKSFIPYDELRIKTNSRTQRIILNKVDFNHFEGKCTDHYKGLRDYRILVVFENKFLHVTRDEDVVLNGKICALSPKDKKSFIDNLLKEIVNRDFT